jgi:hypothetical protein
MEQTLVEVLRGPSAARARYACAGVLVGRTSTTQLVLSAGHCITQEASVETTFIRTKSGAPTPVLRRWLHPGLIRM